MLWKILKWSKGYIIMKRTLIAVTILILLILPACGGGKGNEAKPSEEPSRPPTNVTIMEIIPSSLTEYVDLTGVTEPDIDVMISSEEGGVVESLNFDKGDWVKKDQEMARINARFIEAILNEAKADLALKESNYQRAEKLFARKSITEQERLEMQSLYQMARARYELAKIRMDKAIVESPINGVIIEKNVELGEFAPPGGSIARIQDLSRIKVAAALPESEFPYIKVSRKTTITFDGIPNEVFTGKITYFGSAANDVTRTFPIEILLPNKNGKLKSGMVARLSIVKRQFENAVVIPQDALVQTATGMVAFVLNDNHAAQRDVKILTDSEGRVVIESGLEFGEQLIVTGQKNLVDNQKVKVVEE
jgi:membrane fusion protein (multidrug efflux system)